MHFAICMWGILRSLQFTLPSFQKHLFSVLTEAGHTYDIFVHTYKVTEAYNNPRSGEVGIALNHSQWKLLDPTYIFVEDQSEFDRRMNVSAYSEPHGSPWNEEGTFRNHMRALNSLYHVTKALELISKSSSNVTYDAVVYIRPDLQLLNDLPVHLLDMYPKETLFTADYHRSCYGNEINDRFAMGKYPHVLNYGSRLDSAWRLAKQRPLHSETLTYFHLSETNTEDQKISDFVIEIPFRFHRMRSTGISSPRDRAMIEDPNLYLSQSPATYNSLYWALSFFASEAWLNQQSWLLKLGMWFPVNVHKGWEHVRAHYALEQCHPHPYLTPAEIRASFLQHQQRKQNQQQKEQQKKHQNQQEQQKVFTKTTELSGKTSQHLRQAPLSSLSSSQSSAIPLSSTSSLPNNPESTPHGVVTCDYRWLKWRSAMGAPTVLGAVQLFTTAETSAAAVTAAVPDQQQQQQQQQQHCHVTMGRQRSEVSLCVRTHHHHRNQYQGYSSHFNKRNNNYEMENREEISSPVYDSTLTKANSNVDKRKTMASSQKTASAPQKNLAPAILFKQLIPTTCSYGQVYN